MNKIISFEKDKLQEIFNVLNNYIGDSEPAMDESWTDEEVKDAYPLCWIAEQIGARLIINKVDANLQ